MKNIDKTDILTKLEEIEKSVVLLGSKIQNIKDRLAM